MNKKYFGKIVFGNFWRMNVGLLSSLLLLVLSCNTIEKKTMLSFSSKNFLIGKNLKETQLIKESKEVRQVLDSLILGILENDKTVFLDCVEKESGVFLDVKGFWTFEEWKLELEKEPNYLSTHFWRKKSFWDFSSKKTLEEVLKNSNGVFWEIYWDDLAHAEAHIKLLGNEKEESYFTNAELFKKSGKWWVKRLF